MIFESVFKLAEDELDEVNTWDKSIATRFSNNKQIDCGKDVIFLRKNNYCI